MSKREIPQHLFSLWGKANKNSPLISLVPAALDVTALDEPIDELDRTMMRDLEALGQNTDGRFASLGQALESKE